MLVVNLCVAQLALKVRVIVEVKHLIHGMAKSVACQAHHLVSKILKVHYVIVVICNFQTFKLKILS